MRDIKTGAELGIADKIAALHSAANNLALKGDSSTGLKPSEPTTQASITNLASTDHSIQPQQGDRIASTSQDSVRSDGSEHSADLNTTAATDTIVLAKKPVFIPSSIPHRLQPRQRAGTVGSTSSVDYMRASAVSASETSNSSLGAPGGRKGPVDHSAVNLFFKAGVQDENDCTIQTSSGVAGSDASMLSDISISYLYASKRISTTSSSGEMSSPCLDESSKSKVTDTHLAVSGTNNASESNTGLASPTLSWTSLDEINLDPVAGRNHSRVSTVTSMRSANSNELSSDDRRGSSDSINSVSESRSEFTIRHSNTGGHDVIGITLEEGNENDSLSRRGSSVPASASRRASDKPMASPPMANKVVMDEKVVAPLYQKKYPVMPLGSFKLPRNHSFVVLANLPADIFEMLNIELRDDVPLDASFYPHDNGVDRPNLTTEINATDGKKVIATCTLPGLVDAIVGEHIEPDLDLVAEFLLTIPYFSEPIDTARCLVLRYLECKDKISHIVTETKTPDWNNMVQMRILNTLRKWVINHGIEFSRQKNLCTLVTRFLQHEVQSDSKKAAFGNSILSRLEILAVTPPVVASAAVLQKPVTLTLSQTPYKSLREIESDALAQEFTLLECEMFKCIELSELFQQSWANKDHKLREAICPNLLVFIAWFNKIAYGVATQLVLEKKLKYRVELLKKFIYAAHWCTKQRNYNSAFEIVAGLNLGAVSKLKKTWKALPKKYMEVWEKLNQLVTNEGNYKMYRQTMSKVVGFPPAEPLIP